MTRCPTRRTYKSRLYHIYNDPEVKDDLNRKAEPRGAAAGPRHQRLLPAGLRLAGDREQTGPEPGVKTPPVMITVANRTETAARIKYAFDHKKVRIDELADPARTLHIDSKVLEEAEAAEEPHRRNRQRGR